MSNQTVSRYAPPGLAAPSKKNKKNQRKFVIVEADMHSGHRLGLCSPDVMLMSDTDELRPVVLGAHQQYMWNLRETLLMDIEGVAGRDEMIHLCVGDATQGNKYKSATMTGCLEDQFNIAAVNIGRVYNMANVNVGRLAKGTAAHVLHEAAAEKNVVRYLSAMYPKVDVRFMAHGVLDVGGIEFDMAHHGPGPGIREWTRGNVARHYLRSLMLEHIQYGEKPPDVFLRAHYHEFVHEWMQMKLNGEWVESHLIILPSWCGLTAHGQQMTHSRSRLTNGMLLFEIDKSSRTPLLIHPLMNTIDLRTREKL